MIADRDSVSFQYVSQKYMQYIDRHRIHAEIREICLLRRRDVEQECDPTERDERCNHTQEDVLPPRDTVGNSGIAKHIPTDRHVDYEDQET